MCPHTHDTPAKPKNKRPPQKSSMPAQQTLDQDVTDSPSALNEAPNAMHGPYRPNKNVLGVWCEMALSWAVRTQSKEPSLANAPGAVAVDSRLCSDCSLQEPSKKKLQGRNLGERCGTRREGLDIPSQSPSLRTANLLEPNLRPTNSRLNVCRYHESVPKQPSLWACSKQGACLKSSL